MTSRMPKAFGAPGKSNFSSQQGQAMSSVPIMYQSDVNASAGQPNIQEIPYMPYYVTPSPQRPPTPVMNAHQLSPGNPYNPLSNLQNMRMMAPSIPMPQGSMHQLGGPASGEPAHSFPPMDLPGPDGGPMASVPMAPKDLYSQMLSASYPGSNLPGRAPFPQMKPSPYSYVLPTNPAIPPQTPAQLAPRPKPAEPFGTIRPLMSGPKMTFGNEVTDELLSNAFRYLKSFQRARVIRDKRTGKGKGFGFVSFKNAYDMLRAIKEMNGKYIGNRPIRVRKSTWKDRELDSARNKRPLVGQDSVLSMLQGEIAVPLTAREQKKFKRMKKAAALNQESAAELPS